MCCTEEKTIELIKNVSQYKKFNLIKGEKYKIAEEKYLVTGKKEIKIIRLKGINDFFVAEDFSKPEITIKNQIFNSNTSKAKASNKYIYGILISRSKKYRPYMIWNHIYKIVRESKLYYKKEIKSIYEIDTLNIYVDANDFKKVRPKEGIINSIPEIGPGISYISKETGKKRKTSSVNEVSMKNGFYSILTNGAIYNLKLKAN